jgi:hypothetical protein
MKNMKNINKVILMGIMGALLVFTGCFSDKKKDETTMESTVKLNKFISDLQEHEKSKGVRAISGISGNGIYIYNTEYAKLYFYNVDKLKSLIFNEKVNILKAIESDMKKSYIIVDGKGIFFEDYISIAEVLGKGKGTAELFSTDTVIYNVYSDIYGKFDGTIIEMVKEKTVKGVFTRTSSISTGEDLWLTVRSKVKGPFNLVTNPDLKANGMTINFKNGPKNRTYYLTGEVTKGKYGVLNPLINTLAVVFDGEGNGSITLTAAEVNSIAVAGLGNIESINIKLVKEPGSEETDIPYTKTGSNEIVITNISSDRTATINLSYTDSKSDIVYAKKVGSGVNVNLSEVISGDILVEGEYDIDLIYFGNGKNDDPSFSKTVKVKGEDSIIDLGTNEIGDKKITSYTIIVQNMSKKAGNIVVNFGGESKSIATTGGTGENTINFEGEFVTTKSDKGIIEAFVDENKNGIKDEEENGISETIKYFGEVVYIGIKGKVSPSESDKNVITAALSTDGTAIYLLKEDGYIYSYDNSKAAVAKSTTVINTENEVKFTAISTTDLIASFIDNSGNVNIVYYTTENGVLKESWKNSVNLGSEVSKAVVDSNSNIWFSFKQENYIKTAVISATETVTDGIKSITNRHIVQESKLKEPVSYGIGVYAAAGNSISALALESGAVVEKWKYSTAEEINGEISVIRNNNISFTTNNGSIASKVYILSNAGLEVATFDIAESGVKFAGNSGPRNFYISPDRNVYGITYNNGVTTLSWKVEEGKYEKNTLLNNEVSVFSTPYILNKEEKRVIAYTTTQGKIGEWHILSDWSSINGITGNSRGVIVYGTGWNLIKAAQ